MLLTWVHSAPKPSLRALKCRITKPQNKKVFMKSLSYLLMTLSLCAVPFLFPALQASEENSYQSHRQAAVSSGAGTPWNAQRHLQVVEKAAALSPELINITSKKTYPMSEEDLQQIYQTSSATVPFFAYSSMIDKGAGAVKAISQEAADTQTLAIAFGIQRTFNREMAAATVEGGWGALKRLNIFKKEDAVLNGVLFDLPLADLLILSKREVGYDLIPVLAMRWSDAVDGQKEPEIFLAYTFLAPDYTGEGTRYTNTHVNPIPPYFNYLQTGLDTAGEGFKAMWWSSSYLADKKTLVSELPYQIINLNAE
jgi:hypothetical protein